MATGAHTAGCVVYVCCPCTRTCCTHTRTRTGIISRMRTAHSWCLARIYVAAYAAATAASEEDDAGGGGAIDARVCVGVPVVRVSALLIGVAIADGGIPCVPAADSGNVPALPNDPAEPALSMHATGVGGAVELELGAKVGEIVAVCARFTRLPPLALPCTPVSRHPTSTTRTAVPRHHPHRRPAHHTLLYPPTAPRAVKPGHTREPNSPNSPKPSPMPTASTSSASAGRRRGRSRLGVGRWGGGVFVGCGGRGQIEEAKKERVKVEEGANGRRAGWEDTGEWQGGRGCPRAPGTAADKTAMRCDAI
ncbi:hypothetical protein C8J57DRAFT_1220129 [Mycena rebaudengoi]|nr:hypothetical protein C8J57DRAFT_1220129 [Mycena rebaudengoi]